MSTGARRSLRGFVLHTGKGAAAEGEAEAAGEAVVVGSEVVVRPGDLDHAVTDIYPEAVVTVVAVGWDLCYPLHRGLAMTAGEVYVRD